MKDREKIAEIIKKNGTYNGRSLSFDYYVVKPDDLADALIAAGIALRGERMKYERLTKETVGSFGYDLKDFEHKPKEFNDYDAFYAYKMAVKRLGELEDKIERGEIDYVAYKDKEIARLTAENAELRATLSKMETVEKELRERLKKAVELPCIEPMTTWDWDANTGCGKAHFGKYWKVLYRDEDGEFIAYMGATKEEAEAMLKEMKEKNSD